jgi:hypothetical protein
MVYSFDPRISELIAQISEEHDPEKLTVLSRQLTEVLDENIKAHKAEKDKTKDQGPTSA